MLITVLFLIFYLCVSCFTGRVGSTAYSLGYWGTEATGLLSVGWSRARKRSGAWNVRRRLGAQYMWPIKTIMIVGLTSDAAARRISELFKDIARATGHDVIEEGEKI
jgi:TRAP-type mannitol/chloroaromatic compound transport system permease small subunit